MSRRKKQQPAIPWSLDRALRRAARSGTYTTESLRQRALAITLDNSVQAELSRYIDREQARLDPEWIALLDMLVPVLRQDRAHGQSVYDRLAKYPPSAFVEMSMARTVLGEWGELLTARRHLRAATCARPSRSHRGSAGRIISWDCSTA